MLFIMTSTYFMQKIDCEYRFFRAFWIILFFISTIAILNYSYAFILQYYQKEQNLWEIATLYFTIFSILLTAGAAIPVISAIFSYLSFQQQVKTAKDELVQLKSELNSLQELAIQRQENQITQQIILYLTKYHSNSQNEKLQIEQDINQLFHSAYLNMLVKAVKKQHLINKLENDNNISEEQKLFEKSWLASHYSYLCEFDPQVELIFINYMKSILPDFIQYNDKQGFIFQKIFSSLIVTLFKFDEQSKIEIQGTFNSFILELAQYINEPTRLFIQSNENIWNQKHKLRNCLPTNFFTQP